MYYITFGDDLSRYTNMYFLRSENEAKENFLKYKAEVARKSIRRKNQET